MKPHLDTHDLVRLLRDDRRLKIEDEKTAIKFFRRTNYYRFTDYSRYFQIDPQNGNNQYLTGSDFDEICALMRRDDALRPRLLIALSEVEMAVRSRFAHVAGKKFGGHSFYLDAACYISDTPEISARLRATATELSGSSSKMVRHYIGANEGLSRIPIWVAVEVLSFGKVAWMFESLDAPGVREQVADDLGYSRATFPRVLHSLSALRNLCAHHAQLWNRNLTIQCPLPINKRERPRNIKYSAKSLLPALLALKKLTRDVPARDALESIFCELQDKSNYSSGLLVPRGVR